MLKRTLGFHRVSVCQPKALLPGENCPAGGKPRQYLGFSMVELMVAIAISSFILLGIATLYSQFVAANSANLKMTRLNQELRLIMDRVSSDLRRAGYWALSERAAALAAACDLEISGTAASLQNCPAAFRQPLVNWAGGGSSLRFKRQTWRLLVEDTNGLMRQAVVCLNPNACSANSFELDTGTLGGTWPAGHWSWVPLREAGDILLFTFGSGDYTCIVFYYDANADGKIDYNANTADTVIYRLRDSQRLQRRTGGTGCSGGTAWAPLNDQSAIVIDKVDFRPALPLPQVGNVVLNRFTITIGGCLKPVSEQICRTLTQDVTVRNLRIP